MSELIETPARRPLKIFAFDPMLGRAARNRVTVDLGNEPLQPGPIGSRVEVIDYDATNRLRYPAVDLDDPRVLMQGGLDPTESHPFFHQQMVYAVVMRVVENFERALGRRWSFDAGRRLRVYPHAMQGRNAYYHDGLHALLFGYFRADDRDVGANLPGQTVFTCLSQDIVAHETAHAMVDRLRPRLLEPTNEDVLAFHEGFADIVAIFQHFTFSDVLVQALQQARGDLRASGPLVTLAEQFGYATGRGRALRSAIEETGPAVPSYATTFQPHDRGAILVAAVFDAFFSTYRARTADLLRIATGGSGILPQGALHPDLVGRLADEAARTAQNILTMCIRAFEYLPPVDANFGDFLRALVTSDSDAVPDDPLEQRNALIEGFRRRGVFPEGVTSLAVDALRWPRRTLQARIAAEHVARMLHEQASAFDDPADRGRDVRMAGERDAVDARELHRFADRHRADLDLHATLPIEVAGFHVSQGWTRDQRFVAQAIIQFVQTVPAELVPDREGLPMRGGTTVVTDALGQIRYVISKPLPPLPLDDLDGWRVAAMRGWRPLDDAHATRPSGSGATLRRLHLGLV